METVIDGSNVAPSGPILYTWPSKLIVSAPDGASVGTIVISVSGLPSFVFPTVPLGMVILTFPSEEYAVTV